MRKCCLYRFLVLFRAVVNCQWSLILSISFLVGTARFEGFAQSGTVTGWGSSSDPQLNFPSGLTDVVGVSAGDSHCVALRSNGVVAAWGSNSSGQIRGLSGWSHAKAISAGRFHTVVLLDTGTPYYFGYDAFPWNNQPPPGLNDATAAVAAGQNFSVALRTNGTVVAWGFGLQGQTNVPAGLSNVTAIAAGDSHALALKEDGTVVSWGANDYGQRDVPAGLSNVVLIAAGGNSSVALTAGGVNAVANGDREAERRAASNCRVCGLATF